MIIKAVLFRIRPNKQQRLQIDTTINCCRFVRNQMIARNDKVYKRRGEHLNYNAMQNLLPEMKQYLQWLKEADSQALQRACRQVDNAYQRFFSKKAGYPKFSSKRDPVQSYSTYHPTSLRYEEGYVSLPKIGRIKALDKRGLPGNAKICQATVTRDHGLYFVSITYKVDQEIKPITINIDRVIGLDYKSNGLYVSSEGINCEMPHFFRKAEDRISKEQRKLSKKTGSKKGQKKSGQYLRQQGRLFKKTRHVSNQRKDFLHKQSTAIAKQYDAVCVESLNMKAMSNKGFGNGKATLDNGYGMFLNMLEYKLQWRGKQLIRIDKWYPSSQICHCCGFRNKKLKNLQIRSWICPSCNTKHDRDVNAAINIRQEGLSVLKKSKAA